MTQPGEVDATTTGTVRRIPDPPARDARRRTRTGFSGPVVLEQVGDVDWDLREDLRYTSLAGREYLVPARSGTDGASVPRVFSWLIPRSGRYLPAAVMHDYAYRRRVPNGDFEYREADQVLLEGMRRLGVPFVQRWTIFSAVRWSCLARGYRGWRGWWRDAAQILLTTLFVLPVVTVPALGVGVSLLTVLFFEIASWPILKIATQMSGSEKFVNPPTVSPST